MRSIKLLGVLLAIGVINIITSAVGASGARARASNPGTLTIADLTPYKAIYAISDVHGMYPALLKLLADNGLVDLAGHWSGGKVLLVVVGDSIDKGPQSVDVIETWMRLQSEAPKAGGRVVVLLGNHEAEFLADPTPNHLKSRELFEELKAKGLSVAELSEAQYPRGQFLRSLPLAARLGNWIFAHAGFLPEQSWADFTRSASQRLEAGQYGDPLLSDDNSLLEAKNWWQWGSGDRDRLEQRLDREGLAGVVFGHQPKALNIKAAIARSKDGRLIKIDNGMAPEAGAHPGSILFFPNPSELADATAARTTAYALVDGKPRTPQSEER